MKKIGVVLTKYKNNTISVFIKEMKVKKKQKLRYFKIKKLLVDSNSFCVRVGDIVEIKKTRPLSKRKFFIVTRIFNKI